MTAAAKNENKREIKLKASTEGERAVALAQIIAAPSLHAANMQLTFNPNSGLELMSCMDEMQTQLAHLQKGDTTRIEAMLFGQAHSLQSIFTHYANKMVSAEYLNQLKVNGALALKAQNQCRQTLAVLAEMKNPKRAIFIKNQATNQQVNVKNTAEIPENISSNPANELLCEGNHATMDSTGAAAASAAYSPMATLENSGG